MKGQFAAALVLVLALWAAPSLATGKKYYDVKPWAKCNYKPQVGGCFHAVAKQCPLFASLVYAQSPYLTSLLNNCDAKITVLCPTDKAIKKAIIPKGVSVEDVLKYHVLPSTSVSLSGLASSKAALVTAYNAKTLYSKVVFKKLFVYGSSNKARVVKGNFACAKGYVHQIDTVLIPKAPAPCKSPPPPACKSPPPACYSPPPACVSPPPPACKSPPPPACYSPPPACVSPPPPACKSPPPPACVSPPPPVCHSPPPPACDSPPPPACDSPPPPACDSPPPPVCDSPPPPVCDSPPPPVCDSPPPPCVSPSPPPPCLPSPPPPCVSPSPPPPCPTCNTVYSIISSNPDLSIFKQIVDAAYFQLIFNDPNILGTTLIPTNAAFNNLCSTLGYDLNTLLTKTSLLMSIISNHIIPGVTVTSNQCTDGLALMTYGHKFLFISNKDGVITFRSDNTNQCIGVIKADIVACKSVVHIINGVLLPA